MDYASYILETTTSIPEFEIDNIYSEEYLDNFLFESINKLEEPYKSIIIEFYFNKTYKKDIRVKLKLKRNEMKLVFDTALNKLKEAFIKNNIELENR